MEVSTSFVNLSVPRVAANILIVTRATRPPEITHEVITKNEAGLLSLQGAREGAVQKAGVCVKSELCPFACTYLIIASSSVQNEQKTKHRNP